MAIDETLRRAIRDGEGARASLSDVEPGELLDLLAEADASYRLDVRSPDGQVTVEVGNGLVVGATARWGGEARDGREAYALLRRVGRAGSVEIEPQRFPSLANILEPLVQLSALLRPSSAPPPPGDVTELVLLPESRPVHVAEPETMELELTSELLALPDDLEDLLPPDPIVSAPIVSASSASVPSASVPSASASDLLGSWRPAAAPALAAAPGPAERGLLSASLEGSSASTPAPVPSIKGRPVGSIPPAPSAPASRLGLVAAAAAAALLFLGVGGAAFASLRPEPTAAPVAVAPAAAGAEDEASPEPQLVAETEDDGDSDRTRARTLAREARRLIRDRQPARAVPLARDAAALRPHLPYYQVVLGDALRGSGRPVAARRAYERALRVRPGYEPARRRLQRRQRALAARAAASEHG